MTNQYLLARITGRDPNLRASDADRERTGDRLRTSHAEGRIDTSELQQRLEHCYEAKTYGQLDALVRDLPRQLDEERSAGRAHPWPWRLLPILLILVVAAAASGHHQIGWLWIPILFIVLRISWWRRRQRWTSGRRGPAGWV